MWARWSTSWSARSRREAEVPATRRILVLALLVAGGAHAACPPAGQTRESLQTLKAAQWRLTGGGAEAAREVLSLALLDCLADPDPLLRDEIAFEALSAWMRARQLSVATLQQIARAAGGGVGRAARCRRLPPTLRRTGLGRGCARRSPAALPGGGRARGTGRARHALPRRRARLPWPRCARWLAPWRCAWGRSDAAAVAEPATPARPGRGHAGGDSGPGDACGRTVLSLRGTGSADGPGALPGPPWLVAGRGLAGLVRCAARAAHAGRRDDRSGPCAAPQPGRLPVCAVRRGAGAGRRRNEAAPAAGASQGAAGASGFLHRRPCRRRRLALAHARCQQVPHLLPRQEVIAP